MSQDLSQLITVPMSMGPSVAPMIMTIEQFYKVVALFNNKFVFKANVPEFDDNRPNYIWDIKENDFEYCVYIMDWGVPPSTPF